MNDIIVTGGTEGGITPLSIAGFANMKALTRNSDYNLASRPFDNERDGFVIAEGAGILVLEEYEHAKKRGAEILGEIIGYGATADAYHLTSPALDGAGAVEAMSEALKSANINNSEVNYINAHGTSTPFNDKIETLAIKKVFSKEFSDLFVSSSKSMLGHLLGAAGAVEAIILSLIHI